MAMKKNTKTERKPKREYIKAADAVGSAAFLEHGDIWLKSSSNPDWAPGVTINTSDNEALSDWLRHITLQDVTVMVVKRRGSDGKDYPELIIQGGNCEDAPF